MSLTLDAQAMWILVGLPLACSAFVAIVPHFDLSSIRQIVLSTIIFWLAAVLYFHKSYLLLGIGLIFILTSWMGSHLILLPATLSIATASILSTSPTHTLIFAHVSIWLILYSLARLGASHRGSTILQTGLFFIAIDSVSLAMWFAPPSILRTSIVCLPALSRLFVLYLAPFSRSLVVNSPRHVLLLWLATQVPIGVNMLTQCSVPKWITSPSSILLSILIAIFWVLHDRNWITFAVALLAIFNTLMLAQL